MQKHLLIHLSTEAWLSVFLTWWISCELLTWIRINNNFKLLHYLHSDSASHKTSGDTNHLRYGTVSLNINTQLQFQLSIEECFACCDPQQYWSH